MHRSILIVDVKRDGRGDVLEETGARKGENETKDQSLGNENIFRIDSESATYAGDSILYRSAAMRPSKLRASGLVSSGEVDLEGTDQEKRVDSKSDEGSGSEVKSKSHDTHKNHATLHKECRSRSERVDLKQKRRGLSKRVESRL